MNEQYASSIREIGLGAITCSPLLAGVIFGLIEVWRRGEVLRAITFRSIYFQLFLLSCLVAIWAGVELFRAAGWRPAWRQGALQGATIGASVALLAFVLALVFQVVDLVRYVRNVIRGS